MLLQFWSELAVQEFWKKYIFWARGLAGCYHFLFELSFWKAESYWVHTQREKRPLELSRSAENASPSLISSLPASWCQQAGLSDGSAVSLEPFGPPCSPSTGASCQVLWAAPFTWTWLLVVIVMGQAPWVDRTMQEPMGEPCGKWDVHSAFNFGLCMWKCRFLAISNLDFFFQIFFSPQVFYSK